MVNGATDAPNAIATVVGTKAMRPGPAIAMAAICNFVGLAGITMVSSAVALTIFKMVDFGGDNHGCARRAVPLPWWPSSCGARRRGTSASPPVAEPLAHRRASQARPSRLQGGLGGVNGAEWMKVVYGILSSLPCLGFGTGLGCSRQAASAVTCQRPGPQEGERVLPAGADRAARRGRGVHARCAGRPEVHGRLCMLGIMHGHVGFGQTPTSDVPVLAHASSCSAVMAHWHGGGRQEDHQVRGHGHGEDWSSTRASPDLPRRPASASARPRSPAFRSPPRTPRPRPSWAWARKRAFAR